MPPPAQSQPETSKTPAAAAARPALQPGTPEFIDELTPVAQYMAYEMNRNAHGEDVRAMRAANTMNPDACIQALEDASTLRQLFNFVAGISAQKCVANSMQVRNVALLAWAAGVRQNGVWDHKPKIRSRFHPRATPSQEYHLYGNTLYFYDVWSNIHCGYVGRAAGFSEGQLLDGAGVEQFWSDVFRGTRPTRSVSVAGPRRWDDPKDRAGIQIGIELYHNNPVHISTQQVLDAVLANKPFIQTKVWAPEPHRE